MEQQGQPQGVSQAGTGLAPNIAAALSYVLGLITGIVFLMIDRDPFVRFHAYQSIFLSVAWFVFWIGFNIVSIVLSFIPFLGFLAAIVGLLLSLVLGLGMLVLVLVLIFKAYQGQHMKLPVIGDMAEKYAASTSR